MPYSSLISDRSTLSMTSSSSASSSSGTSSPLTAARLPEDRSAIACLVMSKSSGALSPAPLINCIRCDCDSIRPSVKRLPKSLNMFWNSSSLSGVPFPMGRWLAMSMIKRPRCASVRSVSVIV